MEKQIHLSVMNWTNGGIPSCYSCKKSVVCDHFVILNLFLRDKF